MEPVLSSEESDMLWFDMSCGGCCCRVWERRLGSRVSRGCRCCPVGNEPIEASAEPRLSSELMD